MRRRTRLVYPLLSLVLVLAAGAVALVLPSANAAISGFVQRCGVHFCVSGKTYYFAGANTYDVFTYGGSYGDTETQYMDKARIDAHMAELQADKVSVLRLWMFSHESWHGFETAKGVYNDQQFALFDYVIESAKAHDIRLIPVFENYWEAYGGIDTRLAWEGLNGGHPGRAVFFDKARCPGCFTQYKNYVNHALNRTNHYSGLKYKDEPGIFAWELMNEPRYQDVSADENRSGATLRKWVDEMASYVKSIDANHMVGAGLEGHESRYGFGGDEGNPFVYIHQSPFIDFTSAHPYPNASWANLTLDQTRTLIGRWISDSHDVVGKPFFMGEFNTEGNADRVTWWTSLFADFEARGGDGSAFWWYPDKNAGGDPHSVKSGDPALAVFRAHSTRMAAKSGTGPTSSPSPSPTLTPTPTPTPTATRTPTPTPTVSPGGCTVTYKTNDWGNGFTADVTIANGGSSAINGWTLAFAFTGNQQITNTWNGVTTQSGTQVTVKNVGWNGTIGANGGTAGFGFQSTYSGANAAPAAFTLNGAACAKR
ncbi:hypothetical protein GCM10022226_15240 [Sphaerisporangium flaviroseum]|uniref:CBM2 domain-containing protein n=1 Tax=Sphaerisporangium flaviroseum TaxID=509199 RepID=A0ABP7HSI5_9ACTN